MKKIILILCCCCLLPLQVHAQFWGLIKSAGKASTKKGAVTSTTRFNRKLPQQTKRVSTVLERRSANAYSNAAAAQARINASGVKVPGIGARQPTEEVSLAEHRGVSALQRAQQVYAAKHPYMQGTDEITEQIVADWLAAENNRLYTTFANSILERQARLPQILHDLQVETHQITKPENPTRWLAQQVPADTSILMIGEGFYHNPSTIDAVDSFLIGLREQMPNRKMILLTQRLEKDVVWTPDLNPATPDKYLVGREPLWKNAYNNGMEVIGLEDWGNFTHFDIDLLYRNKDGITRDAFWMDSYTALKEKDEGIFQKVASVRAQHPDALIIVHVDQDQASYNLPFSLANRLETTNEKLFVTGITSKTYIQRKANPFPGEETQPLTTRTTLFEQMYEQAHLPDEGVVSKGLAKDVGADAWIKVPFNPAKIDTGIY